MVNERYNVIIGMEFAPGPAVQQAVQAREQILNVFRQLNNTSLAGPGGFNSAMAAQFGNDLRRAINQAVSVDVRNSPLFQSMRQLDQRAVTGTTATQPSRFLSEQLALTKAELAREQVQRRSRIPVGTPGGFADGNARSQAQLAAARGVEQANRALENALRRYAAELAREESEAATRTRSEEEARARGIAAINRRTAADERAAQASQRTASLDAARLLGQQLRDEQIRQAGARADAGAAGFAPSYPNADRATSLGRAQSSVNSAERALEIASQRLASIRTSNTRTSEAILAAERRVEAASNALATAREKVAIRSAESGSLTQQFMTGFRGQSDRPYAEQIGQAFKFSVFYGTAYKLLFGITQTFQQTLQEGIEFQQAVTELKLSGFKANESLDDLANSLGNRSVEAGFAPSQGVLVGARSLGLFGATQASEAEQARVADISARVVSRMALGSTAQPADLQTNIAAIAQAFGLGAEGQLRVADLDAYFSRLFGVASGSTIEAVSQAGTVGRAAGFSQEEVTAIAADMISRTGQTPSAVAGFMAQIFSRGGEGSLTSVAQRYGIDPTLELADQIRALAEVYKTATPNEKAEISAAFGRGKVQNAAIALLQDYPAVIAGAASAKTDATGAADAAFELRLKDIGGQISLTTGVLKEFANQLGQTGLLEVLGAGVLVFREVVEAGTGVLELWNELDGPMKAAAAGLILLAAASRSAAVSQGISAATGGAGLLSRAGMGALGAGALGLLTNPVTLAVGGLLAVGALKQSSESLRSAQDAASEVLGRADLGPGSTPDDYRSRAAELTARANDQRTAAEGLVSRLTGNSPAAIASAKTLEAEAERLSALANQVERNVQAATTANEVAVTSFDADGLASSMQAITDTGGTAENQFRTLADALLGTAEAAERVNTKFRPDQFAQESAASILDAITSNVSGLIFTQGSEGGLPGMGTDAEDISDEHIRNTFGQSGAYESLRKRLAGVKNLGDIDRKKAGEIARGIIDDTGLAASAEFIDTIDLEGAEKEIVKYLLGQARSVKQVLKGAEQLTGPQVTAAINLLVAQSTERLNLRPETDYAGRVTVARQLVRTIQRAIARSSDEATPQALAQLAAARRQLVEQEINRLEALRRVAQQNANGRREVRSIGRGFFRREVGAALRGGDQDALVRIVGEAGRWGKDIALQAIQDAINIARQAIQIRQAALASVMPAMAALSAIAGQAQIGGLKGLQDAVSGAITGGPDNKFDLGNDLPTYEAPDTSAAADKETAAERAAARAAANAVRSESAISAARAEIMSARAAMSTAKKGTVEYYNALGSYYAARNSLTDAILAYRQNKYLLGIDITDPVAQAEAALKAARDKLRSDAGKGKDVIAQDQVDVRQAQADAEAQRFQQRLDAVQVAEELGRISHQKYIAYLEHEHDRLNRIKDRTFQQQEQLNQIDQLLQTASDAMQGQWNFGDINLPTPYQVRRRTEELFGKPNDRQSLLDPSYATNGPRREGDVNIHIDGADVGLIKKVVDESVGKHGRTTTIRPRRK